MIALEGSLRTGKYQDKSHPDVTHYTTDVFVDNVEFVGSKNDSGGNGNSSAAATQQTPTTQEPQQALSMSEFEEILSNSDVPF